MMRSLPVRPTVGVLAAAALISIALAQVPNPTAPGAPSKPDTIFLKTTIGSFKLIPNTQYLTSGKLSMSFEGTVMVSGLEGTVAVGPGVRLELDRKDHNRKVYFGKGTLNMNGTFRSVQFFGRNLTASYTGTDITARLYGEFDKNMETGYYWYASDPKKVDWGTSGNMPKIPRYQPLGSVKGKVRDVPKGQQ